jgi:poly(3-hydroxybutyrate) depolymerase
MTTRLALLALVLVACGRPQSSTTTTVPASVLDGKGDNDPNARTEATGDAAPSSSEARPAAQPAGSTVERLSPADACTRYAAHKAEKCEWATRFPPDMGRRDVCLSTLETWFSPSTEGHEDIEKTVACWSLDCAAAATCMLRVQSAASSPAAE